MSSKNRYGFLHIRSQEILVCQLCKNLKDEDRVIILKLYLDFIKLSINSIKNGPQDFLSSEIVKKTIRKTFKLKYKNINELCPHQVIQDFIETLHVDKETIIYDSSQYEVISEGEKQACQQRSVDYFPKAFKQLKLEAKSLCSDLFLINENHQDSKNLLQEEPYKADNTPQYHIDIDQSYAQGNQTKNKQQKQAVKILQKWFLKNLEYPYLDFVEKKILQQKTGMKPNQVQIILKNEFILTDTYLGLECQRKIFDTIIVKGGKRRIKFLKKIYQGEKIKKFLNPEKKVKIGNSDQVGPVTNQLNQNNGNKNNQQLVKTEDNQKKIPLQIQKQDFLTNQLNNSPNQPIVNLQSTFNHQTLFQPLGFLCPPALPYQLNQPQYFYQPYPYCPYPKLPFTLFNNTQWRI